MGRKLRGGEAIELSSDLGGGKTTFVTGLAKGLGFDGLVTSPSFTISNQYEGRQLTLYHFDFHRLDQAGIMNEELAEVLEDPQNVIVVEWPGLVDDILPTERLTVKFVVTGENSRRLEFLYPNKLNYLFPINT